MIGISKLYCRSVEASDPIRYGRSSKNLPSHLLQFSQDKRPVVVWNCTKACNLRCAHCYSASTCETAPDELTSQQAKAFIQDVGRFGSPVLLFSGGEPLMRKDLFDLIPLAKESGLRAVISTNGTRIDEPTAEKLKDAGLSYVGVSLDGLREVNDKFRGVKGAFDQALAGIRACRAAGVKVGLRLTMNKRNVADIPAIFDLLEEEGIPRICFYHLAYAGRGGAIRQDALDHAQTRQALDLIMDRTAALHNQGKKVEVLTVDNHVDGPYLYMRLQREDPARAANALKLLRMNGGNSSGIGIGAVSWNGDVHPDQFWRNHTVGNIKDRPFSEIWTDPDQPLLSKLRNRKEYLHCRCMRCRFLPVCNGNLRARAEAATGDPWGDDPACYLSDEEIAGELPE
jgi:12,18-didecarboxysiroheme deacetylase